MKKYIFLSVLLFPLWGVTQSISTDKNAVIHSKLRVATTNESDAGDPTKAVINIQYLDGLGRPLQTVGYRQSPANKDIISGAVVYDPYGRVIQTALPTPTANDAGAYESNVAGAGDSFYGMNTRPFSSVTYETSALARERTVLGAGAAWATNDKKTQLFDEPAVGVRRYELDGSGNLIKQADFAVNSLYQKRIVDEQGHTRIEVTDKRGRLVQRQQQADTDLYLTTHYVYDELDRLRAVLQPEGYALNASINRNSSEWQQWVFGYDYDPKGRLMAKHVPGGGWTEMVYDLYDRLVWQRTALQAQSGKWSFLKYDAFNRVIAMGEKSESSERADLQEDADDSNLGHHEVRINSDPVYYTLSNSYPTVVEGNLKTITYFDDYQHWPVAGMTFDDDNNYHDQYTIVTGLPTGSRLRNSDNGHWLVSVDYYDDKGRVIQRFAHNLYDQIERTDLEYNFAGDVLKTRHVHVPQSGTGGLTELTEHDYDHVGRKTALYQTLNSGTRVKLANYSYDELGRQKQKKIYPDRTYQKYGSTPDYIYRPPSAVSNTQDLATQAILLQPSTTIDAANISTYVAQIVPGNSLGTVEALQTIDYTYHIRGMLNCINCTDQVPTLTVNQNDFFADKLEFEEDGSYFDGNIRKDTWKSILNTGTNRSYLYSYDAAKRIVSAVYSGGKYSGENFGFSIGSYDKNGNIKTLNRTGATSLNKDNGVPTQFGAIDQLEYFYQGNRLAGITDAINIDTGVGDFKDNGSSTDYTYWADGSLRSDANRGISDIFWDSFLNKPIEVKYDEERRIRFYYDGSGRKLRQTTSTGEQTDYTPQGAIYQNGQLYQITHPEGRIVVKEGGGFKNQFDYKDHLGNLRLIFEGEGTAVNNVYPPPLIVQENAYYPFGLEHKGTDYQQNKSNNFQYNGKEKVNSFGLNWSDYGFRSLDLHTARFISVDPLATDYPWWTTYQYAGNMPINFVDLDGLEPARNPSDPTNQDNRNPTNVINTIYSWSGGESNYQRNRNYYGSGYYDPNGTVNGVTSKSGFTSDSQNGAEKYNLWVNNTGVLYANDVENFDSRDFTNFLMGNMVNGAGPENIIFPKNGTISNKLKESGIANEAVEQLLNTGAANLTKEISGNKYSLPSLFGNGIFHPETFLGSATISVNKINNNELSVQIFNVTSITSGDLNKHAPWNNYPISVVRDNKGSQSNRYGNVSQTYSFTLPIK